MENSKLLKIKIMAEGINISDRAIKKITNNGKNPLSIFEYPTTGGLILKIKGTDIYINASFDREIFPNPSIELDYKDNKYFLIENRSKIFVDLISLPENILEKNKNGILLSDLAMVHLDRLRISPIDGCSFACKFCDMNKWEYKKQNINDLIEAGKRAIDNSSFPVRHILISGGTPKKEDWPYFDEAIRKISENFNLPIDVMMMPVKNLDYLKKLKVYGIKELSINLEIFDDKLAKNLIPQKWAIGRKFYFEFFREAVKVFGRGNVRSILIVGLEPIESTLKGVEEMIKIGVSPVLSPFIPSLNTELGITRSSSVDELLEVWEKSCEIIKKYGDIGLGPRCKPCQHNTLTFPKNNSEFYY